MKWPGSLQKFLTGCFGHADETVGSEHKQLKDDSDNVRPAKSKKPDPPAQDQSHNGPGIAESSRTASERQQSDQSQSDATQLEAQPTSVESSSRIDSDPNEITVSTSSPPAPDTSVDPDAITPVESPKVKYVSVTEALEDRRKLYERLRRKPDGQVPSTVSQDTSTATVSKADGKKPEADSQAQS